MKIPYSVIRMKTGLVRYGHSISTKQYTKKKPNAKHAKAQISIKTILLNNSGKRSALSAV